MLEFDTRQANAMASSINNRVQAISREAVMGLEKALIARNSALADQEFKYLLRNRPYLKLSYKTFDDLESRASACVRAQDELPTIKVETRKAQELVRQVRLAEARDMLALAQYRFSDIRNFISEQEVSQLYKGISAVEKLLSLVEDSLVSVNFEILEKKGVNAANDYLQHEVREKGVCRDKIARIDQAILAVGTPSRKSKTEREIDDVAAAAENTPDTDIMSEIHEKAAKKAQQKLDSLRALEETRARREQKTRDSMDAVAQKAASEESRKNKDLSVQTASKIYDLIEKKKGRLAFDMFITKQALLQRYLSVSAYAMLESSVNQTRDPTWDSGGDKIFYLSPDTQGTSRTAVASSTGDNKEKALAIITEIYAMLDRNENAEAQGRFSKERTFLQTYLDKDAFNMIKESVNAVSR
jgi:hypothetical protein